MVEHYYDAWIQLEDGSFHTAEVPESTVLEMRRVHEQNGGGYFSGVAYFKNHTNLYEGQHVKMKDLLVVEVNGQKGV